MIALAIGFGLPVVVTDVGQLGPIVQPEPSKFTEAVVNLPSDPAPRGGMSNQCVLHCAGMLPPELSDRLTGPDIA